MDIKTITDKTKILIISKVLQFQQPLQQPVQLFQLITTALLRDYTTNPLSQWTYSAVRVLPPKFTS